jgi:hypothetical protein
MMPILELTICEWHDARVIKTVLEQPRWEVVEQAIRALNNKDRNDLYLTPTPADPGTYLCVGGGGGRYIVAGSVRNAEFPTILDRTRLSGSAVRLTIGGQEGEYPSAQVVDLATALNAARHFYDSGGFSNSEMWARI